MSRRSRPVVRVARVRPRRSGYEAQREGERGDEAAGE